MVRSLRVDDSTLTPGQVFSLSATVANEGTGRSADTTLRYYYWRGSAREWTVIGFDSVSSLVPSASADELIRLRGPATAGRHFYTACVEAVAGETNRRNCARSSVRVTVSDGGVGAPDLVVRNARVSDRNPALGQRFRLSADVHNVGTGESEPTRLQYWRRSRGGAWEKVGDDDYVPALATGRHVAHSTLLTAQLGTHEYTACVVRVRGEPSGSNCFRPYVTVTARVAPLGCTNDLEILAGVLTLHGIWNGSCEDVRDRRWYSRYFTFRVGGDRSTWVTMDLTASMRTHLQLYWGGGTGGGWIANATSFGTTTRLRRWLAPGTYTIEARPFLQGATGRFTLTVEVE
ncbi:MAG: hypothetical protein OXH52_19040 [Gammaproteobacteria bacterium]|nr:hypothetical protein [Gammaproteobacteria bacterium]